MPSPLPTAIILAAALVVLLTVRWLDHKLQQDGDDADIYD